MKWNRHASSKGEPACVAGGQKWKERMKERNQYIRKRDPVGSQPSCCSALCRHWGSPEALQAIAVAETRTVTMQCEEWSLSGKALDLNWKRDRTPT